MANKFSTVLILISFTLLPGCQQQNEVPAKVQAAIADQTNEEALTRLILNKDEVKRIGIKTTPVRETNDPEAEDITLAVVPISALIYDHQGRAWIYTQLKPQVFARHSANVKSIEGDSAYLTDGPSAGTQVVTGGVTKLFGKQFDMGYFFTLKNE